MPTSSKKARIALYVVLAFVIVAGVASAYTQWRASQKDAEAKTAQETSDELARCLTGFRLEYVDRPAEEARDAEKVVLELVAKGEIESEAYLHAVDAFAAIESDVGTFERLNRQARKNPDAFLHVCRTRNP